MLVRLVQAIRRRPKLYALCVGGVALSVVLGMVVGPSVGAFTASISEGNQGTAGTLVEDMSIPPAATAVSYNGTSWSAPYVLGSINPHAVSCPSSSFCVAGDYSGDILTYNGTSWSSPDNVDGTNLIYSVSCPSSSFCVAVDSSGNALTYNGSVWSSPENINSNGLSSVSCPSSSFCVATSSYGDAMIYNGTSWSSPDDIANFDIYSVSCPSSSFCVAVGNNGDVVTYNGTSWSGPVNIDGSTILWSVSCPSSSFCVAGDYSGDILTYNGTSWSSPDNVDGTNTIMSVSCPSSSFCVAVDSGGDALTYNGTSWSSPEDVDGGKLMISVSCFSTDFCMAAAFSGSSNTICSANSTDTFSSSCGTPVDAPNEAPGYSTDAGNFSVWDAGSLTPTNDPGITWALTPSACSGSTSTICSDTYITLELEQNGSPVACLYGPAASGGSGCGAPTSSYTLESLGTAGTLTVPQSDISTASPGTEILVTTELASNAPNSDQGAAASLTLTSTLSS